MTKTCAECDQAFDTNKPEKYCSQACRRSVKRMRSQANRDAAKAVRANKTGSCAYCEAQFEMKRASQKFCSDDCREDEYKQIIVSDGRWSQWQSRYYSKRNVKRRALLANAYIEDISWRDLYAESTLCYLCGEETDPNDFTRTETGKFITGRRYPSLDHKTPLSKGGTHERANAALAHMSCNAGKRDRIVMSDAMDTTI